MKVVEERCILFQKYLLQLQIVFTPILFLAVYEISPESLPGVEVVLTPQGVGLVSAAAHLQPTRINRAAPVVRRHPHRTAPSGV